MALVYFDCQITNKQQYNVTSMYVDIEEFLKTGEFGVLSSSSGRSQIIAELGPADPGTSPNYPDGLAYGPVFFHCFGGGIQMAFPHHTYTRPACSSWTTWERPTWLDEWPDKRIDWSFGPFPAGTTLTMVLAEIPELQEIPLLSPTDGRTRIFHNARGNLDITFELENGLHVLSHIMVWPFTRSYSSP